jgi:hypothetical protein
MAPQVVIPNNLVDGTDTAFGSQVLANDKATADIVNGQLATDNLSPSAGIKGSQLSGNQGERVPVSKMETGAVDSRVLLADANAGSPNAAVGTANHIKDGIITKAKLTAVGGSRITLAQLEILSGQGNIPVTAAARSYSTTSDSAPATTFAALSVVPTIVAGNYQFRVVATIYDSTPTPNDVVRMYDAMIDPAGIGIGAIPSATYVVLEAYLTGAGMDGSNRLTGSLYVLYLKLT